MEKTSYTEKFKGSVCMRVRVYPNEWAQIFKKLIIESE